MNHEGHRVRICLCRAACPISTGPLSYSKKATERFDCHQCGCDAEMSMAEPAEKAGFTMANVSMLKNEKERRSK